MQHLLGVMIRRPLYDQHQILPCKLSRLRYRRFYGGNAVDVRPEPWRCVDCISDTPVEDPSRVIRFSSGSPLAALVLNARSDRI
jgi:hypothetical protein